MQTDLSRKQIGKMLGLEEETVKSHLSAARNYISSYLKKQNGQLPVALILWILKIFNND